MQNKREIFCQFVRHQSEWMFMLILYDENEGVCDTANALLQRHFIKHLTAFQRVTINQKLIAFLSLPTESGGNRKSFHIFPDEKQSKCLFWVYEKFTMLHSISLNYLHDVKINKINQKIISQVTSVSGWVVYTGILGMSNYFMHLHGERWVITWGNDWISILQVHLVNWFKIIVTM